MLPVVPHHPPGLVARYPKTRAAVLRTGCPNTKNPPLQSYAPAPRNPKTYPRPGKHCGCAALGKSGGLVLALDNGLHGYDPATGKLNLLVHAEPDEPGNRYNDGRCDRRG